MIEYEFPCRDDKFTHLAPRIKPHFSILPKYWCLTTLATNVHASNETLLLKDACFTKRSPHKINQPDEANASLNYALDCPKCFDDGHRNSLSRILAVHLEFKHAKEPFQSGQPEGYPLRAPCFSMTHSERPTLNEHHDWATVIFCGAESLTDLRLLHFQRVITHAEAARVIPGYPLL